MSNTSADSALSINVTVLEQLVYRAIRDSGRQGLHSDEVRRRLPHLAYSSVTARYSSLLNKGHIFLTGERRKGDTGRTQRVMAATVYIGET